MVDRGASLALGKSAGRPPEADEIIGTLLEEDVKDRPATNLTDWRRFLSHRDGLGPERLHRRAAVEEGGLRSRTRLWRRWNRMSAAALSVSVRLVLTCSRYPAR